MEKKRQKETKKCVIKQKIKFVDRKNCLKASKIVKKIKVYGNNNYDISKIYQENKQFLIEKRIIQKS